MIFFGHFRLPEVVGTPTKPQFQPLSMLSKKVWANILSGAAVMERPDRILQKKNSSELKKSHFFKVYHFSLENVKIKMEQVLKYHLLKNVAKTQAKKYLILKIILNRCS